MYFNKYPFSQNFSFASTYSAELGVSFAKENRPLIIKEYGNNIFRLTLNGGDWNNNSSQAEFNLKENTSDNNYQLQINEDASLQLRSKQGTILFDSFPRRSFGKNGKASMLRFRHHSKNRYYGAGSKMIGLEYTGVRTKFWNTDAFADFPITHIHKGTPDPYYVSIPYIIVKTETTWIGLLLNNAEAAYASIAATVDIEGFSSIRTDDEEAIIIGSESGQPDLFLLAADTLAELTQNFQQLVGTTPLPPLWALGYQQCRWGYETTEHLLDLDEKFAQHDFPVDGLWFDIGYMDEFRVFTTDPDKIPTPSETFQSMLKKGHPVVPIIDPGVKVDPDYTIYQSGQAADIFCKNPEGSEFIGLVWPGLTAFPDFSQERARQWWAEQVEAFAKQGIVGAWLDMNDPSVGNSTPYDMRFGPEGINGHETFHNQYGMGMARATRAGFEAAHPNRRIFLISRSSFIGGGKYAAVWTGDNVSNYHYLRSSIATQLNLALSGIPFNGGDIGGFAENTNARLLRDWMKSACLSPFCRNHSMLNSVQQEPWAFDESTLAVCRNFIKLRYRLMPYLYNLFVAQAEQGSAIMRPLFYDFENSEALELDYIDDAFLVGPSILQAPFLDADSLKRNVPLPGQQAWFELETGKWIAGNQTVEVARSETHSPFFLKEASILPLRRTDPSDNRIDLKELDMLVVANKSTTGSYTSHYQADDGETLKVNSGVFSRLSVTILHDGDTLLIESKCTIEHYGLIQPHFLLLDAFSSVTINGRIVHPKDDTLRLAGATIPVKRIVI
ncbi:glycoside hydrolase family 31 protein [Coraliomargarita sp. SDUM461004]|uniref:Glycoside hydrolase family 31 protein n=1 Tax=Thalassobacterium sedimentorum TaxID=3041258 RepID=A0ABU1AKQ1_9BACT|nr:glycoside hydrolase family 31 protein [Coraliomargarita sp. SDUM461004]MDQ8194763.1 glycoside hydrolase family 31 protein [Coraliomargarita sp. SDUM461004]